MSRSERCGVFRQALGMMAGLPRAQLFNACFAADEELRALEWLLNRINRTLQNWDSYGLVISDEGRERPYTRLRRCMGVFNPIPSQYGTWPETGRLTKNIPIERVVEDIWFKDSAQSYFIQLVDFAAYALLRKERPLPSKSQYGLDTAFDVLDPILAKYATANDPQGIIRPEKPKPPLGGGLGKS